MSTQDLRISPGKTAYYVNAADGDDANPGTSPARAWKTIGRANKTVLKPGDSLLFAAGQTFEGTILVESDESGTDKEPITVSSYGEGQATINAGAGDGLLAEKCAHIKVSKLLLEGEGRTSGNQQGCGILFKGVKSSEISQVEASGFQRAGIELRACHYVKASGVFAHDNGFAGISASGGHLYVGYSRAINNPGDPTIQNNHSGNGIIMCADDSTIEFCEAAENGWDQMPGPPNGPVGIWCHDSRSVTIQFCVSHNNNSTSGDGGGFDFDGGTRDSVLQYNYSYENKSSGYLLWEYGSKDKLAGNTIRYNISFNDGEAGIRMGMSGGQGVSEIEIYNNVVYNDKSPCVLGQTEGISAVNVRNNVLIGPRGNSLVVDKGGINYQGNCYFSLDGTFKVSGHSNIGDWAAATGQEKIGDRIAGMNADPGLTDPANGKRIVDPAALINLTEFMLKPGSPLIGAGLDLKTLFGIDNGKRDFYGNSLPVGRAPSIGIQETRTAD